LSDCRRRRTPQDIAGTAAGVALLLLAGTGRVAAQTGSPPPVITRWNNGLDILSPDGDNELQLGALIQVDGRFAPDDPLRQVEDTFLVRRLRPIIQGRLAKYFEFRLMPDFGNGQTVLYDAYIDVRFSKSFRVRLGKDKTPVGLEQLYSDYALLFPERTLASNLVPNRDVGVQVQGDVGAVVSYIGGVFNGVPDGGANGDIDSGPGKDLAGRVTARPFANTTMTAARGAGVAVGATSGNESGALPVYRSTAQQTFFSYAPGAVADGKRSRVSPAAFYYYKSIGAFSEYARTTQDIRGTKTSAEVTNRAWEVTGSFVLTGEAASERGVVPRQPFDPPQHHWGAFQLIARHSHLAVDPSVFANGLAASGASQTAAATGVGLAMYATSTVKFVVTYERTVFDNSPAAARPPEHAIVFRAQLNLQPAL
jgi:phosphate-selective porin OprO/OprP